MLNFSGKREAIEALKEIHKRYQAMVQETTQTAKELHTLRSQVASVLIESVENFVNELARSPKAFDRSVVELRIAVSDFTDVIKDVEAEGTAATVGGGVRAGASVGGGVAVAALAPSAAMAIATTFGTASTGTAISALSGAAATNASLAWLGGGALAAGGKGMVAGKALLALAGPVGWGVAAVALAGTGFWMTKKNREVIDSAQRETEVLHGQIHTLEQAQVKIRGLSEITFEHSNAIRSLLEALKHDAPRDYIHFSQDQKNTLSALINHIQALTGLLNERIT